MAFQCSEDLEGFLVLALADKQTRRVGQKGAHRVDAESKEELKGEWKSPCHIARRKRKAERKPVGNGESSNTICYPCSVITFACFD